MSASRMFRQEALDQLRSPDDLDRLLTVVRRRTWIHVLTLGLLCGAGLVWAIWGTIPVTVDGTGVLVHAGRVTGLQATAGGQLVALRVRVGQQVRKGDVIAIFNQDPLQKELRQEEERVQDLERRHTLERQIAKEQSAMDHQATEEQRKSIQGDISTLEALVARTKVRQDAFADDQAKHLDNTKALLERLHAGRQKQLTTIKTLRQEGLTSQDLVLNAETTLTDSEVRIADLAIDLQRIELRRIEAEQEELRHRTRVGDLQLKLLDLSIQERRRQQVSDHQEATRKAERDEAQRRVDRLKFLLARSTQVTSEHDGRILELAVSAGQVVGEGARLGTIELQTADATLENVAYFPVKDGKRIQLGDVIHVTPTTVQRERFGSIVGRVTRVAAFPTTQAGAINIVGTSELAGAIMPPGGAIEVEAELQPDPTSVSGYRWTSQGPPLQFSAGTTTTVRVTIERRRPISYLFPFVRTWVLGQKDEQPPSA
ncbi:MAG: NHLP bacteriocin system secretion protein [Planctomycetota bacterium]|nr:NHLP bacteriocin system secretion protein [Planctomycetota bacterium]